MTVPQCAKTPSPTCFLPWLCGQPRGRPFSAPSPWGTPTQPSGPDIKGSVWPHRGFLGVPSAKLRYRDQAERRGPYSGGGSWKGPEIGLCLFQERGRASPVQGTVYKQSCTRPPLSEGESTCPHPSLRPPFLIWTMASRLNLSFQDEDKLPWAQGWASLWSQKLRWGRWTSPQPNQLCQGRQA